MQSIVEVFGKQLSVRERFYQPTVNFIKCFLTIEKRSEAQVFLNRFGFLFVPHRNKV